ncbi:MAG: ATP-binding protein [Ruminococcaceae bacterium]|nr:ATP-binding protein [Oscillospiraceae bacterium]
MKIEALYESYFHPDDYRKPYASNGEYLADRMRFLDVCLTVACAAKGLDGGDIPAPATVGFDKGLSVSSTDLFSILDPVNRIEPESRLTPAAKEQVENAYFHVECRTRMTLRGELVPSFEALSMKFALDEAERFALLLAFAPVYDRKYEAAFTYLHNNSTDAQPTRWLAVRLYRLLFGILPDSAVALMDGTSPVTSLLIEQVEKSAQRSTSAEKLTLKSRVASYILGSKTMERKLEGYAEILRADGEMLPVREAEFGFVREFFRKNAFRDDGGCAVMNLYGPDGIGRRYFAAQAAAGMGLPILSVDIGRIVMLEEREITRYLEAIRLETVLTGAIPCFVSQFRRQGGEEESKLRRDVTDSRMESAAETVTRLFRFAFWVTEEREQLFIGTRALFVSRELPMLSAEERKIFWNAWADKEEFAPEINLDICASQYILTPRDLKRVLKTASDAAGFQKSPITRDILKDAIRQHSKSQLGLYATLINAVFTWDDLVVSDEQKRRMKMICDQVRYRRIVGEEWGFRKKSPYGNGLCALFYGSPGTGKTMAVQVMANELGIDLYRIDLSQLVSKYIGETQKNISELFNKAKNINAMLFFDEADSMFAKRSEVKDSNDRYANADTAFLLQKLEDYEGITILATNYVNNIDDAFKRRIKFMVNFVFPTADVRLMLWKKIAPKTARFDEAIDFEFFADSFELTGSNIKEILTNAAYLAASEASGIRNRHIIEAIKLNFSKYGKVLTDDDFGYLGR